MKRSPIWKDVDTSRRDPMMPPDRNNFTITIEPKAGNDKQGLRAVAKPASFAHPFNLGTDEPDVRRRVREMFKELVTTDKRCRHGVETIALWRRGRMYATFDGRRWTHVERAVKDWEQMEIAATKPKQALRGSKSEAQMALLLGTLSHSPFGVQFATIKAALENDKGLANTKAFAAWAKANLKQLERIAAVNGHRSAMATSFISGSLQGAGKR